MMCGNTSNTFQSHSLPSLHIVMCVSVLVQVLIFIGETLLCLNWAVTADILLVSDFTCGFWDFETLWC